jgi:TPR repeat protein
MRAPLAGHPPAANMLGRCLERGWGGEPDMTQAAAWYRRAAEATLDWGQYNLANMLLRGRGVTRDLPQALAWFRRAADQGHAKSMNLTGRILEEGWVGPIDELAAAAWYRWAADGGDFRAQYNLGTLLARAGRLDEAVRCFTQAGAGGSQDFRGYAALELLQRLEATLRRVGLAIAERCCDGGEGEDYLRYGRALAEGPEARPKLARAWLRRAFAAGVTAAAQDIERLGTDAAPLRYRRWRLRWRTQSRSPANALAGSDPAG